MWNYISRLAIIIGFALIAMFLVSLVKMRAYGQDCEEYLETWKHNFYVIERSLGSVDNKDTVCSCVDEMLDAGEGMIAINCDEAIRIVEGPYRGAFLDILNDMRVWKEQNCSLFKGASAVVQSDRDMLWDKVKVLTTALRDNMKTGCISEEKWQRLEVVARNLDKAWKPLGEWSEEDLQKANEAYKAFEEVVLEVMDDCEL